MTTLTILAWFTLRVSLQSLIHIFSPGLSTCSAFGGKAGTLNVKRGKIAKTLSFLLMKPSVLFCSWPKYNMLNFSKGEIEYFPYGHSFVGSPLGQVMHIHYERWRESCNKDTTSVLQLGDPNSSTLPECVFCRCVFVCVWLGTHAICFCPNHSELLILFSHFIKSTLTLTWAHVKSTKQLLATSNPTETDCLHTL